MCKYIKTIQRDNKSYKYDYQYINAIYLSVICTTKAASYFPRFHENASKVFYNTYSSIIPYLFQNSPPHSKQFPSIKQKWPQLTTYVVKFAIEKNKINQNHMRETHMVIAQLHWWTEGHLRISNPGWTYIIYGLTYTYS